MGEPTRARSASGGSGTQRTGGAGRSGGNNQPRQATQKKQPEQPKTPKGEERLKRKHDTDSGMTTAQKAAVNRFEEKHRNYKTERVVAIDENGKEWGASKTGKRDRTSLGYCPPNTVITHNHPGSMSGRSMGLGTAFSHADIKAAIKTNAKEIRVVAGRVTYSLRRPASGWGVGGWEAYYKWERMENKLQAQNKQYLGTKKLTAYQRHNVGGHHAHMKALAKEFGWIYTRKIEPK